MIPDLKITNLPFSPFKLQRQVLGELRYHCLPWDLCRESLTPFCCGMVATHSVVTLLSFYQKNRKETSYVSQTRQSFTITWKTHIYFTREYMCVLETVIVSTLRPFLFRYQGKTEKYSYFNPKGISPQRTSLFVSLLRIENEVKPLTFCHVITYSLN